MLFFVPFFQEGSLTNVTSSNQKTTTNTSQATNPSGAEVDPDDETANTTTTTTTTTTITTTTDAPFTVSYCDINAATSQILAPGEAKLISSQSNDYQFK